VNEAPIVRDVVLVGGGHSHALLVRRWAMRPLAGVRLTLVSDGVLTPYSGMLPGHVAGHYTVDEVHIDLLRLCLWAGVRFIDARMTGLDPQARTIDLLGRPPIGFDRLSLDTGSTPDLSIPGARAHATPVKPVSGFVRRWHAIRDRLPEGSGGDVAARLAIGVVGSGAGGFEILSAVQHALSGRAVSLHWVLRGRYPLSGRHVSAQRAARRAALDAGIEVHTGFDVEGVEKGPVLVATDGRRLVLDELLWCTGAVGPDWPAAAGLEVDQRGFVLTDATLRSLSHPWIYATGDIGSQQGTDYPKAGVHAVRQAPLLHDNLRADLLGEPLRAYRPQSDFLSLMATGPEHAIANRSFATVSGAWVWRWKDRIDRRFMQRFERLPVMPHAALPSVLPNALRTPSSGEAAQGVPGTLRCRGCGAKVGSELLREALRRHDDQGAQDAERADPAAEGDSVRQGLRTAGDVSIIAPGQHLLVQSVDQLSALFDDPWRFARIATLHALSDVLTVEARPHSALLVLTLPPAGDGVQRRELSALLDGVTSVLAEHGVRLIGGHTAEGPQLQIALTINALAAADLPSRAETAAGAADKEGGQNAGDSAAGRDRLRAGDALVLTRPIGTGVLFAGAMRAQARGQDLIRAIEGMETPSASVATCLRAQGARRLTDVTGFGLAGHLERMLAGSGMVPRLQVAALPMLSGARTLAQAGVHSSLFGANRAAVTRLPDSDRLSAADTILLADPQTAGGLLAVLPAERCDEAMRALLCVAPDACVIGTLAAPAAPAASSLPATREFPQPVNRAANRR